MKTEETKGRTMLSSSGRNVCISSAVITKNKNKKLLEKKNGCQKSFLFSLFLFGFLLSCLLPPTSGQYQVYRQDPFAMLSATLQTYQRAACDGQTINLDCPPGTKIAIQLVQYGRSFELPPEKCEPNSQYPEVLIGSEKDLEEEKFRCSIPGALKHIEEKCHDQQICSMVVAPEVFGGGEGGNDPCPQVRKVVEVAYKCKPTKFRSKVTCHSQTLELDCSKKQQPSSSSSSIATSPSTSASIPHHKTDEDEQDKERLAIYSATFASAIGSHIYCPDTMREIQSSTTMLDGSIRYHDSQSDDGKKCINSYATEAVMRMCHGKRSCEIFAEGNLLGAPACSKVQSIYLKVVYACINKDVLKSNNKEEIDQASEGTESITDNEEMQPSIGTITPSNNQKANVDKNNINNINNNNMNIDTYSDNHNDQNVNAIADNDGEFDRSYIISSSHESSSREEANFADTDIGDSEDKGSTERTITNDKEVSIVKAKDQSKLKQQSEVVVGIASDILSSYKHITDNTEEFLLFVGLAVALGLGLFLALVVWGMYRSNRLTRIKNRLRKPSSNIMTTSDTNTGNGTMSDIIDAYVNSPITGSPIHSNGGNCPPGAVNLELEICDHEVDSAFRGLSTSSTAPNVMSSTSSPASTSNNYNSSSTTNKQDEKPPFNSTHQILGMYPVPNKYGNGTQIYGTLGRQQRRQQRPLSSNGGTLQLNGRPRSQRLDSDGSSSIILNPSNGHPNLIEPNSFPHGAHIISHPGGGQVPYVTYHPNEWLPNNQYIGMHPHEGSVASSTIDRVPMGGMIGERNSMQSEVASSCANPLNIYNNNPHIISASLHSGSQLRGGSIPSASDTNYIPDLEDTSSVVGGGLAPLPMQPISEQHMVRYSTIGRPHNRMHNYPIGNGVTSPSGSNCNQLDHHIPCGSVSMSHKHPSPSLCSTSSSLAPSTSIMGPPIRPNGVYPPCNSDIQHPIGISNLPIPPQHILHPSYNDQNVICYPDISCSSNTAHQNTNGKLQQKQQWNKDSTHPKSDTMTDTMLFGCQEEKALRPILKRSQSVDSTYERNNGSSSSPSSHNNNSKTTRANTSASVGFTSPEVKEVIMDFDKCDDDDSDEEEQYFHQMTQSNYVHFETSLAANNYPPDEVIFINDAQLHTYVIHKSDPMFQEQSINDMIFHPKNTNIGGAENEIDMCTNGESMTSSHRQNNENNTKRNEDDDEANLNNDVDEDEVLIYDTEL